MSSTQQPKRVLHCVVNMNRGGAETLIMNIYRNIDRSKIQFDFLTNKPGVFDGEIEKMGGKVYRIPYVTDVGHFGYIKVLNNFFKEHNEISVVHSHMDKMSGLVLSVAKKNSIPLRIAHSHNTSSEGNLFIRVYKDYVGLHIRRNANKFLACSGEAAKWLFNTAKNKVVIFNNGIDVDAFVFNEKVRKDIRTELGVENAFVVGHVGRFNEQKNHTFLIDIFRETIKRRPESKLVLVGDGTLRKDIEKKVADYGMAGNVMFLGVRSDISKLLQAFDVFVFPSLHEGLPVALIEAQTSGLKCIVSESISKDVKITKHVDFISLIKNPTYWAENVIRYKEGYERSDFSMQTKRNGYDINENVRWLEIFYLKYKESSE